MQWAVRGQILCNGREAINTKFVDVDFIYLFFKKKIDGKAGM